MNKKGFIFAGIIILAVGFLLTMSFITEFKNVGKEPIKETIIYNNAKENYQVYLDGEKIGLITSKNDLYNLINEEQVEIKNKYNVDQVYPPNGFDIVKINSYDNKMTTVEDVYDIIKEEKEFTIKGYTITIKKKEENIEPKYIYVLDQEIFKEAVNNIINTFIGKERYQQYTTNTQPEIVDTGYIIENMYFNDTITIKESYIGVNEKIYTNVDDLTRYLLYGDNNETTEYEVVQGDTIEKIALAHKLNTSELLIANDNLRNEDTLLAIGQKINVTLINPVLTLVYEELIVEDNEQQFESTIEEDNTQYVDYRKVKQEGVNGINRTTSRGQFINGEPNQAVKILSTQVIRPAQNQITVKGTKKYSSSSPISGHQVDLGGEWAWPTNQPYVITSGYEYRWGTLHDGIDISGTGYGSPIYATLDGVVYSAQWGGIVGSSAGYNVVIEHSNGIYTVYAHCSQLYVKKGEYVARGQRIAAMGHTGWATGTHLHLGVFVGLPYNGGYSINPMKLWQR